MATRNAAIASDATVSSPRNFCSSRSHGIGKSMSGAYARSTSEMFAATAVGATRRDNCAQMRTRSFHGIGRKRPRLSRREPSAVCGDSSSDSASLSS